MRKCLIAFLLNVQRCSGMQPQRNVCWPHRLPYHPDQFILKRLQVRLMPQVVREVFSGLCGTVPPSVETLIDEGLGVASL